MAEDTGGLLGFLGRGYDPAAAYGGLLSEPSTQDAMKARALAAMAGAFGRGALPSPYKGGTPFLATLGQAAEAAYGGQDELIKARTQAAQASLYGTQADVAKQNLQLGRAYIQSRMQDAADDKGGGGGGLLGPAAATGVAEGPGGVLSKNDPNSANNNFAGMRAPGTSGGGPISNPGGWQKFATPEDGLAAIGNQLDRYASGKTTGTPLTTLSQIVTTWAPPSENDTPTLVARAAKVTGFAPDQPLNMADPTTKAKVVEALIRNEHGGKIPAAVTAEALTGVFKTPSPHVLAGAPSAAASAPPAGMPPNLLALPSYAGALAAPATPPLSTAVPPVTVDGVPPGAAPPAPAAVLPPGVPPVTSIPGGTNGIVPAGAPPGRGADAGMGLLGPQIPEAVRALAQQAGGIPAQFAGPGAADPGTPPPAGPNLVQGGGARPLIAPVVGPMPPASLLAPQQPAPIMPAGPPTLPPGAQPGAMPPPPVSSPGAVPATGPVPGAPTPDRIRRAQEQAAILTVLGKSIPPDTAAILKYNIDVASAGAQARAKAEAEQPTVQQNAAQAAQVKAQYDLWVKQNEPQLIRKGTTYIDPTTGRTIQNPDEVKTVDKQGNEFLWHSYPSLTPDGVPRLVPLGQSKLGPGVEETLKLTAGAQPITVGNQVMQQGPGYTQPITTAAGSTIPPAAGATPISGTKSNLDKRGEDFAKVESDWGKSVAPAAQAVNRVQAIMTAMKEYETGTWASKKSEIVGMLKSVGINLGNAVDDPAQAQIILKNNFGTALNIMQSTGLSRWTQAELFGAQANSANPDLWAKANHAIGAQTIGVIDWEQQMLKDYREFKKYAGGMVDPQDFQQRWVEANPLQPFVDRAHEQIGPLKGEPAASADIPVAKTPADVGALKPGSRYSRPGDPAGSYRVVPQPGR